MEPTMVADAMDALCQVAVGVITKTDQPEMDAVAIKLFTSKLVAHVEGFRAFNARTNQ
jgi:hypothetical protein